MSYMLAVDKSTPEKLDYMFLKCHNLVTSCFLFIISVSNFEVQSDSVSTGDNQCGLEKDLEVVQSDHKDPNEYQKFCETSSDHCIVKAKPKSGVLKKLNILVTRIFAAKL